MTFQSNNQYYTLRNGTLTTAGNKMYGLRYLEAPYGMETPNNFSFVCTRTHFRLYDLTTLAYLKVDFYIEYLQVNCLVYYFGKSIFLTKTGLDSIKMQAFYLTPAGANYTFGKVNYCQGYFTGGIWMAITASLLLTLILAFGISLLCNIKTMDRFDDPKGKPLTIAMEK